MNPLSNPPSVRTGAPLRLAFIQAQWHADIVRRGCDGFLAELARHGVAAGQVDVIGVPGAFEIPLHAQALARGGRRAVRRHRGLRAGGRWRHLPP